MQNKIENILAELYSSDPSLKQHEDVLRKVIVELMELKPNTQFDEQFRVELRRRLMALAETQATKRPIISLNFMKRFQLVGAGIAVVTLLAVSAWYLNGIYNPSSSNLTNMLSGPKITRAGENAFGSLANVQSGGRGGGNGGTESLTASDNSVAPSAAGGSGVASPDAKLIAPVNYNVRYVYNGEELTLVQDKVDVLKRVKNENAGLGSALNQISLGLINLNSFGNSQLQSFNFAEDRELGYMVNVSLSEGSISINENWNKWLAFTSCPGIERSSAQSMMLPCEPKRIDPSQVPSDSVLIGAANAFLDEHNIPRTAYGEPAVNMDWKMQYDLSTDKANYWIPDVMSVVYPLVIDGQTVHDESGNLSGMVVSVRFSPEVKVSGVWDLTTQNYQSSSYQAETDVKRIMGLVERGGFRNYYYLEPGAKTVDVELGTPEVSMVKLWNYNSGLSEELLVPALIFPVTKQPTEIGPYFWYRKNVVIPLVKEILDTENANNPPIRILDGVGATEPAVLKAQ
jgi:hypothetical protein